jgi:hypothetical protein
MAITHRNLARAGILAACIAASMTGCHKDRSPPAAPSGTARPESHGRIAVDPALAAREAAVPEDPMKNAYFGETHLHTSYSLDAYIGGARLTPDDAYRFARGEKVTLGGQPHSIVKPLDFAVVTDHAEYIGEMYSTQVQGAPGYAQGKLEELRNLKTPEEREKWYFWQVMMPAKFGRRTHPSFFAGPETTRNAWQDVIVKAARDQYEPGRFTTLVGFEWTAVQSGGNMHRNVIFRDMAVPDMPLTSIDTTNEEKLWAWMAEQEAAGSKLLAIPHNSNASKGLMFAPMDKSGNPIDAGYARTRSKWEPLIEMMQVKGNSEVVASIWSSDEFAGFENAPSLQDYRDRRFIKENFVRWAVIKGLAYQRALGVNPYRLGFVGGTDSHNGTPGDVVEDNFVGSHGAADSTVDRRRTGEVPNWLKARDESPGALAGVWATKNTRGAIWDAMKSRETFATSGTRIRPRFFCGAGLPGTVEDPVALVRDGYSAGVPMGGTLASSGKAPTCTVYASKDPDGANLDRIQIIKGWVDARGEPQEKIIDVAWSGERKRGEGGKLPPVGNTVDLRTATYTNGIGSPVLMGSWTDPDFDPKEPALYYVRVLEIPTPRWTTYDSVRNGLPLLADVPATIQERAWTSPIWYSP